MGLVQVTEEFLRKLVDLAGNPHAKEELNQDVTNLVEDAKAPVEDVAKEVSSGQ